MVEINGMAHASCVILAVSEWATCRKFYEALLPFFLDSSKPLAATI